MVKSMLRVSWLRMEDIVRLILKYDVLFLVCMSKHGRFVAGSFLKKEVQGFVSSLQDGVIGYCFSSDGTTLSTTQRPTLPLPLKALAMDTPRMIVFIKRTLPLLTLLLLLTAWCRTLPLHVRKEHVV